MSPFISIIVPIYKIKEEYLCACLDSLKNQGREDYNVILIDDGSPDHSGEICDRYAEKYNIFQVIHQKNRGVSIARNNGIDLVKTQWVSFVDPDDWIESDYIDTLYEVIKNNADIVLFDYFQEFDNQSKKRRLPIHSGFLTEEWIENVRIAPFHVPKIDGRYYSYEYGVLWNKVYRTEILKNNQIRFIEEARKGQDALFNAAVYQHTDKFYYLDKPLYHYRYLQESITNRYNEKIVYYNEVGNAEKERILSSFSLPEKYWIAYYSHALTRLYSCMRLYYFHPDNKMTWKEKKKALDEILLKEPYITALIKSDWSLLSHTQKVFTYLLKKRKYFLILLLVRSYQIVKGIKGEVLQKR